MENQELEVRMRRHLCFLVDYKYEKESNLNWKTKAFEFNSPQ